MLRANWDAFWAAHDREHAHAGLIWNAATRAELRQVLQVRRGDGPGRGAAGFSYSRAPCRVGGRSAAMAAGPATGLPHPCSPQGLRFQLLRSNPPHTIPPPRLQAEETALHVGKARAGGASVCWNHEEFRAELPSLQRQLAVGGVHVKLLLDGADSGAPGAAADGWLSGRVSF